MSAPLMGAGGGRLASFPYNCIILILLFVEATDGVTSGNEPTRIVLGDAV